MSDDVWSVRETETYYDSEDADRFYYEIWGGEDIHVGLYEDERDSIRTASRRTVEWLASRLTIESGGHVLDIGSGYGGAARWLVGHRRCKVTCLNLSETQNSRNRAMNVESGLDRDIEVVHGNFAALPFFGGTFKHVWCQDALLHSNARSIVLAEAARVLERGGDFIFTDPMQHPDTPARLLGPLLERLHLRSLATFDFYRQVARVVGFEVVHVEDRTPSLAVHYARVHAELAARRTELEGRGNPQTFDRMLDGVARWAEAGERGHLAWGMFHFRKVRW